MADDKDMCHTPHFHSQKKDMSEQTHFSAPKSQKYFVPIKKKFFNSKETAFYLGISDGALRNMVYRGELKPHKPKKRKSYFAQSDLDNWIKKK